VGRIGGDRVRVLARIADDVRHRRLLPALIDFGVALGAGCGTDVVGGGEGRGPAGMFGRVEWAKGAEESDDGPGVVVGGGVVRDPGGHAGELDTVFDDVVKIAVGEVLGGGVAEVGNAGVEIRADGRAPAAVGAMTDGAAGEEGVASLLEGSGGTG